MTNEEAIKHLHTYSSTNGSGQTTQDQHEEAKRMAIKALSEQRWIPVSERVPEDYKDVLVWFEYFRYGNYNRMYSTHGIGTYSKQYDSWMVNHESGWKDLHILAWMPLPEPYQGD